MNSADIVALKLLFLFAASIYNSRVFLTRAGLLVR